jgi:uncharacterized membrane protein required for colicin V production
MGLDLILAVFVLIESVRGWLKGFVLQAVRLGGLVACVYEATPVRDAVKPHVAEYLKGIRPELLDRLLWWAACVVSYVVTVGLATWLVRVYRRRPYGEPDLYRGDQAAGFVLGAAKGLLISAFLVSGIETYAVGYLKNLSWAEQQALSSRALTWNEKYHPAGRIWATKPVQTFAAYVQKMGLPPAEDAASDPVRTASRTQELELPGPAPATEPNALDELQRSIDAMEKELRSREPRNWR